MPPFEIVHYVTCNRRDVFQDWLDGLRDTRCRVAILRRVDRLAAGHPGDQRFCGAGVWELRIDCGPGYRVYFARIGVDSILLLGAGSKRRQRADIETAIARRREFKEWP
jgi:putative addiction module killer protein